MVFVCVWVCMYKIVSNVLNENSAGVACLSAAILLVRGEHGLGQPASKVVIVSPQQNEM